MTSRTVEEFGKSVYLQQFANDVREELKAERKFIKPKYFYDTNGSELFEEICRQPEYYPTRTEASILQTYSPDIAKTHGSRSLAVLELGSGSSEKTRVLLKALLGEQKFLHYLPIDISESMLRQTARRISGEFHGISVTAIPADYYDGIAKACQLLSSTTVGAKLILFLGSSIGNFEPQEAEHFLRVVGEQMGGDDSIMIGFDLHKPKSVLERAYNDRAGVTEKFNLNVLAKINKELDGEFDVSSFGHNAFYNETFRRIEMHLVSKRRQSVHVGRIDETFDFAKGETIHTENSHKYSVGQIEALAEKCGFRVGRHYMDERRMFDLALFVPSP